MNKPGELSSNPKSGINDQAKQADDKTRIAAGQQKNAPIDPAAKAKEQMSAVGDPKSAPSSEKQSIAPGAKQVAQPAQQAQAGIAPGQSSAASWKQQVGAARLAWDQLTDDELVKSEGQMQKLSSLVKGRYALSQDEADKQVKAFLEKNKV